jgi:hypothetical protein
MTNLDTKNNVKTSNKIWQKPRSAPLCPIYNDPEKQQSQSYKNPWTHIHTHTHTHIQAHAFIFLHLGTKQKVWVEVISQPLHMESLETFFCKIRWNIGQTSWGVKTTRHGYGSRDFFYTDYNFQIKSLFCNLQTTEEMLRRFSAM